MFKSTGNKYKGWQVWNLSGFLYSKIIATFLTTRATIDFTVELLVLIYIWNLLK